MPDESKCKHFILSWIWERPVSDRVKKKGAKLQEMEPIGRILGFPQNETYEWTTISYTVQCPMHQFIQILEIKVYKFTKGK